MVLRAATLAFALTVVPVLAGCLAALEDPRQEGEERVRGEELAGTAYVYREAAAAVDLAAAAGWASALLGVEATLERAEDGRWRAAGSLPPGSSFTLDTQRGSFLFEAPLPPTAERRFVEPEAANASLRETLAGLGLLPEHYGVALDDTWEQVNVTLAHHLAANGHGQAVPLLGSGVEAAVAAEGPPGNATLHVVRLHYHVLPVERVAGLEAQVRPVDDLAGDFAPETAANLTIDALRFAYLLGPEPGDYLDLAALGEIGGEMYDGTLATTFRPVTLVGATQGNGTLTLVAQPAWGTPPYTVSWSSSLQGPLGTGATLDVALVAGDHALTATVTDAHGAAGSASMAMSATPPDGEGDMVYEAVLPNHAHAAWTRTGSGYAIDAEVRYGGDVEARSVRVDSFVAETRFATPGGRSIVVRTPACIPLRDGGISCVFAEGGGIEQAGPADPAPGGNVGWSTPAGPGGVLHFATRYGPAAIPCRGPDEVTDEAYWHVQPPGYKKRFAERVQDGLRKAASPGGAQWYYVVGGPTCPGFRAQVDWWFAPRQCFLEDNNEFQCLAECPFEPCVSVHAAPAGDVRAYCEAHANLCSCEGRACDFEESWLKGAHPGTCSTVRVEPGVCILPLEWEDHELSLLNETLPDSVVLRVQDVQVAVRSVVDAGPEGSREVAAFVLDSDDVAHLAKHDGDLRRLADRGLPSTGPQAMSWWGSGLLPGDLGDLYAIIQPAARERIVSFVDPADFDNVHVKRAPTEGVMYPTCNDHLLPVGADDNPCIHLHERWLGQTPHGGRSYSLGQAVAVAVVRAHGETAPDTVRSLLGSPEDIRGGGGPEFGGQELEIWHESVASALRCGSGGGVANADRPCEVFPEGFFFTPMGLIRQKVPQG